MYSCEVKAKPDDTFNTTGLKNTHNYKQEDLVSS